MKLSRLVVLVVILVPIGLIGYQLHQNLQAQRESEVDPDDALVDMLPQAFQMIQNFHRVEVRDGEKVWEVEAEEAQYLKESDEIVVREPRASFFLEDGGKVTISGGQGIVHLVGRELKRIRVRDNVEIHVRDFVIRVDGASYDRARDRIVTRGPVHIVGDTLELRGRGMKVDVETSSFTVEESVRVTLRPGSPNAPAS